MVIRGTLAGTVAALLLATSFASARTSVIPVSDTSPTDVGRQLEVLQNPGNTLKLHDVLGKSAAQRFRPLAEVRNRWKEPLWLRFALRLDSGVHSAYIRTSHVYGGPVDLYVVVKDRVVAQHRWPGSNDRIPAATFTPFFFVSSSGWREAAIYLSAGAGVFRGSIDRTLIMMPSRKATGVFSRLVFMMGICYGVFIVIAVYNVALYRWFRDRAFLWYVSYLLTVGTTMAIDNGDVARYVFPSAAHEVNRFVALIVSLAVASLTLFLRASLPVAQLMPRTNRVLVWLVVVDVLIGLAAVITPAFGTVAAVDIVNLLMLVVAPLGVGAAIGSRIAGYRPATVVSIALLPLALGAMLTAAMSVGILPYSILIPIGRNSSMTPLSFAATIETLLLSMAVAARTKQLRNDLAEAALEEERARDEDERQKMILVEQQRRELEQRVIERSAEIAVRHEELELANEKLVNTLDELNRTEDHLVRSEKVSTLGPLTRRIVDELAVPVAALRHEIGPMSDDAMRLVHLLETCSVHDDAFDADADVETDGLDTIITRLARRLARVDAGARHTGSIVGVLGQFTHFDQTSVKISDLHSEIELSLHKLAEATTQQIEASSDEP